MRAELLSAPSWAVPAQSRVFWWEKQQFQRAEVKGDPQALQEHPGVGFMAGGTPWENPAGPISGRTQNVLPAPLGWALRKQRLHFIPFLFLFFGFCTETPKFLNCESSPQCCSSLYFSEEAGEYFFVIAGKAEQRDPAPFFTLIKAFVGTSAARLLMNAFLKRALEKKLVIWGEKKNQHKQRIMERRTQAL